MRTSTVRGRAIALKSYFGMKSQVVIGRLNTRKLKFIYTNF